MSGATARLECKVCWYVYDPAVGDPVWQVAPGTPFADLPTHWTCPNCATEKSGFLPLDDEGERTNETEDAVAGRVQAAFERVRRERMAGLPFVNEALRVELVGTRRWRGLWLGVLVTPWFMNLVLLPGDEAANWPAVAVGEYAQFEFPAGVLSFLAGREGEAGEYLSCSLFSPMLEFGDHATARQTAEACLIALFDERTSATVATAPAAAPVSKRDFLRGRWRDPAAATPATER